MAHLIEFPVTFQVTPLLIFITAGVIGITIAGVSALSDMVWFRVMVLVMLGGIALVIAFNIEWVSPRVEDDQWLENFFLNLSTELFGALLFLAAFNFWKKSRRLNFLDFMFTLLLLAVGLVLNDAARNADMTVAKAWMRQGLAWNLSIEILGTLIIQLAIIITIQGVIEKQLPALTMVTGLFYIVCVVIITVVAMFLLLWGGKQLPPDLYERFTLFTAVTGAFITMILFSALPDIQSIWFPLFCIALIGFVSVLLFEANDIDLDLSINFSTELFGALMATLLLEIDEDKPGEIYV